MIVQSNLDQIGSNISKMDQNGSDLIKLEFAYLWKKHTMHEKHDRPEWFVNEIKATVNSTSGQINVAQVQAIAF